MRRGSGAQLPVVIFGLDHQTGRGACPLRTIRARAGCPRMNRIWYFATFIVVTGIVFGALVGFDKLLGGAG